jgi:hypothetical protein
MPKGYKGGLVGWLESDSTWHQAGNQTMDTSWGRKRDRLRTSLRYHLFSLTWTKNQEPHGTPTVIPPNDILPKKTFCLTTFGLSKLKFSWVISP